MANPFEPVADTAALDRLWEQSRRQPVLLFKHDPMCHISAFAHRQLAKVRQVPISLIDVAHDRDVSREVAQRAHVRHESPQVILLRDGQAVWSASHYAITADAVELATTEASGTA